MPSYIQWWQYNTMGQGVKAECCMEATVSECLLTISLPYRSPQYIGQNRLGSL